MWLHAHQQPADGQPYIRTDPPLAIISCDVKPTSRVGGYKTATHDPSYPPTTTAHAPTDIVTRGRGRGQQRARQRGRGRPLVACPSLAISPTWRCSLTIRLLALPPPPFAISRPPHTSSRHGCPSPHASRPSPHASQVRPNVSCHATLTMSRDMPACKGHAQ